MSIGRLKWHVVSFIWIRNFTKSDLMFKNGIKLLVICLIFWCRRLLLARAQVAVVEAPTSAADSYTAAFHPETGAIAGLPAGFLIRVRAALLPRGAQRAS